MEKYHLKFQSIEQINDFLRWGDKIDGRMDISSGALNVDAKSLLGIMNVGLNREMVLSVQGQLTQKEKSGLRGLVEFLQEK